MTGVLQLVFCDRGTPKAGSGPRARNVYTELRDALVERGMKPEEIAFMHDYDNPKAKAKLVEACADGRIRVLITSTKKGGTGLNVQRALKQMVNLDPAWTAADMEQRIGRIIRQGNVNETVSVVNMVARRSYDAMMYQYVARKASFVGMIRKADLPPSMEDIGGDLAASWAQSKAAATGDPVFVQQVEADQRVANLEARRDAVLNANAARNAAIRGLQANITATEKQIPSCAGPPTSSTSGRRSRTVQRRCGTSRPDRSPTATPPISVTHSVTPSSTPPARSPNPRTRCRSSCSTASPSSSPTSRSSASSTSRSVAWRSGTTAIR